MSDVPVVLLTFANHIDPEYRLSNLARERDSICKYLRIAELNELCEVKVLIDPNYDNLIELFHDREYKDRIAIFHFAGHADTVKFSLESLEGKPEFVFTEGFAKFLGQQKNLKLIFLNGCETSSHAKFLHNERIPFVISTKREVDDNLAANSAIRFYQSLAADKTIDRSFKEVRGIFEGMNENWSDIVRGLGFREEIQDSRDWKLTAISSKENPFEWCFSKAKDDPLFNLPKVETTILPLNPFVGLRAYIEQDLNIFWGRDYEIRAFFDLLHKVAQPSTIICHGVKGVGKTSFLRAGIIPRLLKNEYVVQCIIVDKHFSVESFRKLLLQYISELESSQNKGFIFIFGLSRLNESFLQEIEDVLKKTKLEISIVLEMNNLLLSHWLPLFVSFRPNLFHLLPLNRKSIDSILQNLAEKYNVISNDKFVETFASLILSDPMSGVAPILQFVLESLFNKDRIISSNSPRIDMSAFINWDSTEGFSSYIDTQISKIDSKFEESGLALEFLNECTPTNGLSPLPDFSELNVKYRADPKTLEYLVSQLREYYLISEPVSFEMSEFVQNRLYHNILAYPLKDITDNSYRPVQKIRRLLNYNLRENKQFDMKEINLIRGNQQYSKVHSSEEETLLYYSIASLRDFQKKRKYQTYFKYSLLIIIMFFGIFFNSPYLLMYLILLFVFYVFENSSQSSQSKKE